MRLIDADDLKAKMFDIPKPKEGATFWDGVDTVGDLIDNAPTVDIRNNGACENCEYFGRSTTEEPCRNCTLAYGSCFKEKEKVKEDRPQGECCGSCYLCDVADCKAKMKGGAEWSGD